MQALNSRNERKLAVKIRHYVILILKQFFFAGLCMINKYLQDQNSLVGSPFSYIHKQTYCFGFVTGLKQLKSSGTGHGIVVRGKQTEPSRFQKKNILQRVKWLRYLLKKNPWVSC